MKTKEEVREKIKYLCWYYESYSCSEAVWRILADVYDVMIPPDYLKISSINRGGACAGGRCGILESTIAFLSYIYGRENSEEEYVQLMYWSEEIHKCFIKQMHYTSCDNIWEALQNAIAVGKFKPKTHCIIYEGLVGISDVVYDAYMSLKRTREAELYEKCEMSSIKEKCNYYLRQNYVCSEAALRAILEKYDIEWTNQQKRVATIFQKGAAIGDRCGVIEVALLVLSYKYGRLDSREENLQDRLLARRLLEYVRNELGSCQCSQLTDMSEGIEKQCPRIYEVLDLCEEIFDNADDIIKNELKDFEV